MPMKISLQTSASEKKNIWLKAAPMIAAGPRLPRKSQAVLQRGWKHQIRGILNRQLRGIFVCRFFTLWLCQNSDLMEFYSDSMGY